MLKYLFVFALLLFSISLLYYTVILLFIILLLFLIIAFLNYDAQFGFWRSKFFEKDDHPIYIPTS